MNLYSKVEEYELKAAFFERFARFIDWPDSNAFNKQEYFTIQVVGDNPFGNKLEHIYKHQLIKNKKVKIIYAVNVDNIKDCNILFISHSVITKIPQIFDKIKSQDILLVGDSKGICELGVHINFYLYKSQLKFQINPKELKKDKFQVSHLLLYNSTIVNTKGGADE